MKHISPKLLVLALLVPLGACESGEFVGAHDDTTAQVVVATDDTTAQVAALYRNGGDSILLKTRRIVTELEEADGVRSEWYLQVDASAPEFEVEVTAVDAERGIRLVARGDRLSVESEGASAADKDRAMALFGEATLALASEAAIPVAERRLLDELGGAAATHPSVEDPILTPLDADQDCYAENQEPTFTSDSVIAKGTAYCGSEGRRKFAMCIQVKEVAGSIAGQLWNDFITEGKSFFGQWDLGCEETPEYQFREPQEGRTQFVEVTADRFCSPDGSEGKTFEYQPHLRSVTDFSPWWTFGVEVGPKSWHTLAEGPNAVQTCGDDMSDESFGPAPVVPKEKARAERTEVPYNPENDVQPDKDNSEPAPVVPDDADPGWTDPGSGGGGGGGGGGGEWCPPKILVDAVPVTDIAGASGSDKCWKIATPAGKRLVVSISGGTGSGVTGDVDLYTRFGAKPTNSTYDCRPYLYQQAETCTVDSTLAGDYYIRLRGYTSYSGVTLRGDY